MIKSYQNHITMIEVGVAKEEGNTSPLIFNTHADKEIVKLKEWVKKWIKSGREIVNTIHYADDISGLAKNEEDLDLMLLQETWE